MEMNKIIVDSLIRTAIDKQFTNKQDAYRFLVDIIDDYPRLSDEDYKRIHYYAMDNIEGDV